MAKKLKLQDLKIQSFVTNLDGNDKDNVKGGGPRTDGCTVNCTDTCVTCPCQTCIFTNIYVACACNDTV